MYIHVFYTKITKRQKDKKAKSKYKKARIYSPYISYTDFLLLGTAHPPTNKNDRNRDRDQDHIRNDAPDMDIIRV
jgi:hypothetical protein